MGVYLEPVNFEELFRNKKHTPVILNDVPDDTMDQKDRLNGLIYTRFYTDLLSNLPSCECGAVVGEYNLGVICKSCNHPAMAPMDQDLEPILWVRKPKDVEKLMSPIFWTMLRIRFSSSGFEVIRWLCGDVSYKVNTKIPEVVNQVSEFLQATGIQRSYNSFVRNFDTIMDALFKMKGFKGKRNGEDPLQQLLREYRHCVFTDYLPLPNRALLVLESNPSGIYADPIVTGAVDAINIMKGIDTPMSAHTAKTRENRTVKHLVGTSEFFEESYRSKLGKKDGHLRKHVFGWRSHFSFRAVIDSITMPHDYDELHIPWGIGVSVFKIHLANLLMNRHGMEHNQVNAFLNEHAEKYHPLLATLFQTLINESPYYTANGTKHGIPVVFQRNPSLERASAQMFFITLVKGMNTDENSLKDEAWKIPTVSLSDLCLVGFNADFDGDQLNGTLGLDHATAEDLVHLAPHKSAISLDEPRQISRNLSFPKPVVSTMANWLHTAHREPPDPKQVRLMDELLKIAA